jgi:hypothetical protein
MTYVSEGAATALDETADDRARTPSANLQCHMIRTKRSASYIVSHLNTLPLHPA